MNVKFCHTCSETKPVTEFHRCRSHADGLASLCKACKKIAAKALYQRTGANDRARMAEYRKANPEKVSEAKKRCYYAKKDQYSTNSKAWYRANREYVLAQAKEYRVANAEAKRRRDAAYVLRRLKADPIFALTYSVRNRVGTAFRQRRIQKGGKTHEMLGCDWAHLKLHIEQQFQPGMSWENRSEWHIDHIIPLASAKTAEDLERLCHYTNLQPLWAADNIRKGAKIAA